MMKGIRLLGCDCTLSIPIISAVPLLYSSRRTVNDPYSFAGTCLEFVNISQNYIYPLAALYATHSCWGRARANCLGRWGIWQRIYLVWWMEFYPYFWISWSIFLPLCSPPLPILIAGPAEVPPQETTAGCALTKVIVRISDVWHAEKTRALVWRVCKGEQRCVSWLDANVPPEEVRCGMVRKMPAKVQR
jgi:hypothetical protein